MGSDFQSAGYGAYLVLSVTFAQIWSKTSDLCVFFFFFTFFMIFTLFHVFHYFFLQKNLFFHENPDFHA